MTLSNATRGSLVVLVAAVAGCEPAAPPDFQGDRISLRANPDEVAATLHAEVQERLDAAGVADRVRFARLDLFRRGRREHLVQRPERDLHLDDLADLELANMEGRGHQVDGHLDLNHLASPNHATPCRSGRQNKDVIL